MMFILLAILFVLIIFLVVFLISGNIESAEDAIANSERAKVWLGILFMAFLFVHWFIK